MAYYLIAVSTRHNLDLCLKHALAGFTGSFNGAWAFCDICEDDYVSFLYGATAYNLYRVDRRSAYRRAASLPPWPPIVFRSSGKVYDFPFRLQLQPVRALTESLVKHEFAYVAQNLLLRGGYRKTHFQADQTTLQRVSQLGNLHDGQYEKLVLDGPDKFEPRFTFSTDLVAVPEVYPFREITLQSLIKRRLTDPSAMEHMLRAVGVTQLKLGSLEVLSERAFPEGHVDLLVKEAVAMGSARQIVIEVKAGTVSPADIRQVLAYRALIGAECVGCLVIGKAFQKSALELALASAVTLARYSFNGFTSGDVYTFEELLKAFHLEYLP